METFISLLLIIIVIIVQGYISELHNDSLHDDLIKKLEDLNLDSNKQKPANVDVDFMVESYKQRLWKNCKTTGDYAFVDACATAFREGIKNTLDELDLNNFINKSKENG